MFTFFTQQQAKPTALTPDCRSCGLALKCENSVLKAIKRPSKTVIVVNGPNEDSPNGLKVQKRLSAALEKVGLSLHDYSIVPAMACPSKNLDAKTQYWKYCQPLMIQQIKALNPEKIIVYGKYAIASVIDWLWRAPAELPDRWIGRKIPCRELNAWILPIGNKGMVVNPAVSQTWLYRFISEANAIEGRPYAHIPDYRKMLRILNDAESVKQALGAASRSKISAFDYETNCLRPEKPRAKIFTASVAWLEGDEPKCVAFPMKADFVEDWKAYLLSDSTKIAANMKFEHRWSKKHFDVDVKRLMWDTNLVGHMYDPQPGVTSLKFQAFRDLGLPFYAGEVEKYFTTEDSAGYNSIHLANSRSLLEYNAIDSLAELDLGILQMYQSPIDSNLWTSALPKQRFYTKGMWL
jgi:hypothetical protein